MKSANRSNGLLVELLIVVMFFMLSATVLLQVFTTARTQSEKAGRLNRAMNAAQNVADQLYAGSDAVQTLKDLAFADQGGQWLLSGDDYDLVVAIEDDEMEFGVLHRFDVSAVKDGETLLTLPAARYREGLK